MLNPIRSSIIFFDALLQMRTQKKSVLCFTHSEVRQYPEDDVKTEDAQMDASIKHMSSKEFWRFPNGTLFNDVLFDRSKNTVD